MAGPRQPRLVVGLDFAFSFPLWWVRQLELTDVRDVWRLMLNTGHKVLADCGPPFWGRPGVVRPQQEHYRRTEQQVAQEFNVTPKSVFQIGGAGAVGTGSVRGMPFLLDLQQAGFSIWPFDAPGQHVVLEIYPRVLTGPVAKSSWVCRHMYLRQHFSEQDSVLLERATGNEDAFDAAVSALGMAEHISELEALHQTSDPQELLEGAIWCPPSAAAG